MCSGTDRTGAAGVSGGELRCVAEEAEKQARASVERAEESLAHNNAANALAHDEYDDQIFEGVLEKGKQPGIMKLSEQEEREDGNVSLFSLP